MIKKNSDLLRINRTVEADGRLESKDESVVEDNFGDSSTFTEEMDFDSEVNYDIPNTQQAQNQQAVQISPLGLVQDKPSVEGIE